MIRSSRLGLSYRFSKKKKKFNVDKETKVQGGSAAGLSCRTD